MSEKLRTIYHVYDEEYGEVEGMFTQAGELIDTWCCNDAHWRHEYFEGFMKHLGVVIKDAPGRLEDKLRKRLREQWRG